MSPTAKRRIAAVRKAGPEGYLSIPDRTMMSLEDKGFLRSEIDTERVLSLRYFLGERSR